MKRKMTLLLAVAVTLAYSPAFAEEDAHKGHDHGRHATEKKDKVSPAPKKGAETAGKAKAAKAAVRKVTKEEAGQEAVCPVTGEKFKVTEETPSVSYKDKNYYFCCPGCDTSFIKNPGKFLAKKKEAGKPYACPMGCAEAAKPGKCPKCGMNLVEKK